MIPPTRPVTDEPGGLGASPDDGAMTDKQRVVLRDLCDRTGEEYDESLTGAQAEARIAELRRLHSL